MAEHAVGFEHFAATRGNALQLELRVIPIGDGPALDGDEVCGAVAQLFERLVHVGVLDLDVVDLDLEVLILSQIELRQHLEGRAKLHRPSLGKIHLVDLRLRNRHHLVFAHRAINLGGDQRLQHFALDVVGESAPDQRHGRLPGTESRHARHARKFPRHAFHRLLHILGRDFQFQLAPASRFSHRRVFDFAGCANACRIGLKTARTFVLLLFAASRSG